MLERILMKRNRLSRAGGGAGPAIRLPLNDRKNGSGPASGPRFPSFPTGAGSLGCRGHGLSVALSLFPPQRSREENKFKIFSRAFRQKTALAGFWLIPRE